MDILDAAMDIVAPLLHVHLLVIQDLIGGAVSCLALPFPVNPPIDFLVFKLDGLYQFCLESPELWHSAADEGINLENLIVGELLIHISIIKCNID